jgi:hypothetical protein
MKISKGFALTIVVTAILAVLAWMFIPKLHVHLGGGGKDTPVVIVGGCLHGKADKSAQGNWTAIQQYSRYSASVGSGKNDNVKLTQFNNTSYAFTGTGGWAVTYTDEYRHRGGTSTSEKLCSDQFCSASKTDEEGNQNSYSCSATSIDPNGLVYLKAGSKEDWYEVNPSGSAVTEVDLQEKDQTCVNQRDKGKPDGACEKISEILLETCNAVQDNNTQKSQTYPCTASSGNHCDVKIGDTKQ